MAEALMTEPIPLVADADGVIRVRGTRVTMETILTAFDEGATAEEIAQQYPSISLADVYQVIGYYLRHSSELEPYLGGGARIFARPEDQMSPDGRRPVSVIVCLAGGRRSVALAGGRELQ